ncbi:SAM-dependent methyltransferase [Cryptosporangium phraense]|uniref:SAM-dependent methyltransferase n=1 Tax=Cryptosporangium phraense TaxID=2593070 RepID=A0A545B0N7_9ACTN|nr:SAM-dependent methyltransferase [Cryptosporangium phraense]
MDVSVAHPARRYDYWLGGTVNFAADRASGDAIAAAFPQTRTAAIENRRFLGRAVSWLYHEAGVRQFLDVGTGIPGVGTVHELAPEARVVYVDNDPIVLLHSAPLLSANTTYLEGDLRAPDEILARAPIDFDQPVGLLVVSVLHFLEDAESPYARVAALVDALAPGSYLALTHGTIDHQTPAELEAMAPIMKATPGQFRSFDEVSRFFDGLTLVQPGLVSIADWPEPTGPTPAEVAMWGGIGRKP